MITGLEQGFIKLDYKAPGVGGDFSVVFAAVAESPIPEPGTVTMVFTGSLLLLGSLRMHHRRHSSS